MAFAALVFLNQQLENLLPKHDDDEYGHFSKIEQMESLHSNVMFLQKHLKDFPGNIRLIKTLESQITDVAYQVSNIISWGIANEEHQKIFKSCTEEVDSIVENAKEIRRVLEMKTNILGHDSPITSSPSIGAAPCDKGSVVGFQTDLTQIKERVLRRNPALQIIPITGMGGIGKTTLARYLYEDPLILAHFDVRSWVIVSQEHNAEKILKGILGDAKTEDKDPLIVCVHKELTRRRFLIVLDDIWNVEAWDCVRNAFPDDKKGSRVVITTRLAEVATKVSSLSPLHEMQLMNEVQSWELFKKEAFGQECFLPQLENVGKIISKNCKGLPLAIVVIARLLKLNHTDNYWKKFAINMKEAVAEASQENQLMEILSLSYDNLPPHLKACFLYTSMFPEDYQIPSKNLKWLWIAEGFLKSEGDKSMEEVAEKCLVDLVDRNLILVGKMRSTGRIKTCTVHDVLRDMGLIKAKEDKFSQQIITRNTDANSQVVVYRRCVGTLPIMNFSGDDKCQYIYSLILHDFVHHKDLPPAISSNLLRVLDVLKTSFPFVTQLGVNLRYLAFTYYLDHNEFSADNDGEYIDTFANIRKLKSLETLIIRHEHSSPEILFFPILEMPKLKHFVVHDKRNNYYCLIDDQDQALCTDFVSNKSFLETLTGVSDLQFTPDAIEIFANLVKLKIYYTCFDDACLYNLVYLHKLEELTIYYLPNGSSPLPTNIAFPYNLKKITLWDPIILWETMSLIGSLPNLEVLKLTQCEFESDEWEPVEGEFQQLKYLKLGVLNLVEWKVESVHFPCLEQLILYKCHELRELPAEVGEIDSLQKLILQECNKCIVDSARDIEEEQQSFGNCGLQILVEDRYNRVKDEPLHFRDRLDTKKRI